MAIPIRTLSSLTQPRQHRLESHVGSLIPAPTDYKNSGALRGDRIKMQSASPPTLPAANIIAPTAGRITYRAPPILPVRPPDGSPASDKLISGYAMKYTSAPISPNGRPSLPICCRAGLIYRPRFHYYFPAFLSHPWAVPNQPPKISLTGVTNGTSISLRLESLEGQPSAIVASTNQSDWSA